MKKKLLLLSTLVMAFKSYSQKTITEPKLILPGHTEDVEALAVSPSGNWIATGSRDKSVVIYKNDSVFSQYKSIPSIAFINALKFSNDGKQLAVSSHNSVTVYDSIFRPRIFDGHQANINALLFDRSSKYLYSGADNGTLLFWDLSSGKELRNIANGFAISSLAQSNDPRMLYVADAGPKIKIYNLTSSTVVKTLDGHTDAVNSIDISKNNLYLLSGSNDKSARIWDLKTGKELKKLPVACWKVTAVAFSDDSKYAITGCNDGSIKIWEVETGKLLSQIEANGQNVRDLSFLKNYEWMAVAATLRGSTEYGLRIWPTGVLRNIISTVPVQTLPAKDTVNTNTMKTPVNQLPKNTPKK
jgi:WD40 repeat protein